MTLYKMSLIAMLLVLGVTLGVAYFIIDGLVEENLQTKEKLSEVIEATMELSEDYQKLVGEYEELYHHEPEFEVHLEMRNITKYAPLDPNAVEGMCYSGDPNITASGRQVVIGKTVAAGPDIPFGTKIFIQGLGWRTVTDRGGAVGNDQLDVAVHSREEAMMWGIKPRMTVILKPLENVRIADTN